MSGDRGQDEFYQSRMSMEHQLTKVPQWKKPNRSR